MTAATDLVLLLDGADGAPREAWRVATSPEAVRAEHDLLVEDFRAMSGAHGMTMETREIRRRCWAPLVAKLEGLMASYTDGPDTTTARFADRALCYLAVAGLGRLEAGDTVTVTIAASGDVACERTPHRLLHRNQAAFGNLRREMEAMALAMTQMP